MRQWEDGLKRVANRMPVFYLFGTSANETPIPAHPSTYKIIAPCEDHYEDIPMKMYYGFKYVHLLGFDYVIKIDENVTSPNFTQMVDIVSNEMRTKHYVALKGIVNPPAEWGSRISFYHSAKTHDKRMNMLPVVVISMTFAGGPGYALSREALSKLTINDYSSHMCEDYATGMALRKYNITVEPSDCIRRNLISDTVFPHRYIVGDIYNVQISEAQVRTLMNLNAIPVPTVTFMVHGGLGNQLFQIATSIAYSLRTHALIQYHCNSRNVRAYYWDGLLQSMKAKVATSPRVVKTYREPKFSYTELPVCTEDTVMFGYFQSDKYFKNIIPYMRALLTLPSGEGLPAVDENTVFVHARRGDYLTCGDVHTTLTNEYYEAAKAKIKEKITAPKFILSCDDPGFWRDNPVFRDEAYTLYEGSDVDTFALMLKCRHFIMANSTFSWWGATLADAETVIAPSVWFGPAGHKDTHDLYREGWIVI